MEAENHIPGDKWEFNQEVTDNFDAMLANSIPSYETMRKLTFDLGCTALAHDPNEAFDVPVVVDLGASRGEAVNPFIEAFPFAEFHLLEISEPMLQVLHDRYDDNGAVIVRKHDLRHDGVPSHANLVLSILTLQFTPIEYRPHILESVYNSLPEGGMFILVEKVIGASAPIDRLMVDTYLKLKGDNGYTEDAIRSKRASLEGVLVPMTAKSNEDMLRTTGFKQVDCFYRHLNFAGWVCIK